MLANPSKSASSSEVKIMRKSQAGRLHTGPDMGKRSKEKEEGMFSLLSLRVISHSIIHPCFVFPDIFLHSGFCFAFFISPDVLCSCVSARRMDA